MGPLIYPAPAHQPPFVGQYIVNRSTKGEHWVFKYSHQNLNIFWHYIGQYLPRIDVLIIYWQHINQILAIYWRWWFHHLMAKFWSELTEFCRNSLPITSQRNLLWWWWRWRWRSMTMMMTMVMMMMILSRQQWILSDVEDDVGKWWYFSAVNFMILLEKLCHRK